jgi:hypothetical protein
MFKLSSLLDFFLGPRLYLGGGGGGGGGQPANTTQTQTQELPEWARGYAKDTLAKTSALTDINQNPYKTYDANRIAGFSPLQQQSMTGAQNMAPAGQLGEATGLAGAAGQRAMNTQYTPGQFGMMQARGPSLQQYQMDPAQQVGTQDYTGQNVSQYMNPYMQNVVDIQQREAQRQGDIAGTQRAGQAVRSGAFGGSRAAVMDAEAARNLATQKGDIQAQGQNAAFQNAQQQFNTQQGRDLQAQLANQGAGLQVGQQNLGAQLGVQQLGAGQNLQAQLANQQMFQQAQQAREQSRQYGAGYGMQGLQTGLQAAGQLGQLGGQQFAQGMDINKLQAGYGAQQQALEQQGLSQSYQDFQNQQNYPYKQLGFMSDILRGTPTGSSSSMNMYQAPPSNAQNLTALGMGAYGLKQLGAFASGGEVKTYAGDQGSVTSEESIADIVDSLSDQQLQDAYKNAQARQDVNAISAIETELAQRASERSGMSAAYNQLPPDAQENMQQVASGANGGIVAFQSGGGTGTSGTGIRFNPLETIYPKPSDAEFRGYMNQVATADYTPLTDAERQAKILGEQEFVKKTMGPSELDPFKQELSDKRASLKGKTSEMAGLSLLMSIGDVLEGNNAARGIGKGVSKAAGVYGGLKKENDEADRVLLASQVQLGGALEARKDGQFGKAMQMQQDAETARAKGIDAKRDIAGKLATLTGDRYKTDLSASVTERGNQMGFLSQLESAAVQRLAATKPSQFKEIFDKLVASPEYQAITDPTAREAMAARETANMLKAYPNAKLRADTDALNKIATRVSNELSGNNDYQKAMRSGDSAAMKRIKEDLTNGYIALFEQGLLNLSTPAPGTGAPGTGAPGTPAPAPAQGTPATQGKPKKLTQAEYDKAPSGTVFIAPDNSVRTKP